MEVLLGALKQAMKRATRARTIAPCSCISASRAGAGRALDRAGRHRQRQPVLRDRAGGPLRQARHRARARREHGADGRCPDARRVAVLPLRHADGAGEAAATRLGRGQPQHRRRSGGRALSTRCRSTWRSRPSPSMPHTRSSRRSRSARSRSGKDANLTVLDRSPYAVAPDRSEGHRGLGHDARGSAAARDGQEGAGRLRRRRRPLAVQQRPQDGSMLARAVAANLATLLSHDHQP